MPKGGAAGSNKFAASKDAVADDRNWVRFNINIIHLDRSCSK